MAYQAGLAGDRRALPRPRRKAADFVVAHGPSFGSSAGRSRAATRRRRSRPRSPGWSRPARIADVNGDPAAARVYRATADHFQRSIKGWTVTTTGPYGAGRYFIRLSKNGDPNAAHHLQPRQRQPRRPTSARSSTPGFLELTRLGDPAAGRPRRAAVAADRGQTSSAADADRARASTATAPTRPAPRTATATATCPTRRTARRTAQPWPTGERGLGAPVAGAVRRAGRARDLQAGDRSGAAALAAAGMDAFASGIGLVPEQAWENPTWPPSPFGSRPDDSPRSASQPARPAGSASPLTWAQAQEARLALSTRAPAGRSSSRAIVRARYVDQTPPANIADDRHRAGRRRADPRRERPRSPAPRRPARPSTVASTPTDIAGDATRVTTTAAASDGVVLARPCRLAFGTNVLTVASAPWAARPATRRVLDHVRRDHRHDRARRRPTRRATTTGRALSSTRRRTTSSPARST